MKQFNSKDIEEMDRIFRLNLINSLSGYKSANLIGTKNDSSENLAIFSSVIHLGSNPPLLGFIMRPHTVARHTLENIKATGFYTINHISAQMEERAHYSSASFEADQSEFELCNIVSEYLNNFPAPFVKESQIKIGMNLVQEIPIEINQTIMIIGKIQTVYLNEGTLKENGSLDLNHAEVLCISGLNDYHLPKQIASFPYARVNELPQWK